MKGAQAEEDDRPGVWDIDGCDEEEGEADGVVMEGVEELRADSGLEGAGHATTHAGPAGDPEKKAGGAVRGEVREDYGGDENARDDGTPDEFVIGFGLGAFLGPDAQERSRLQVSRIPNAARRV